MSQVKYEHSGVFDWRCLACRTEGSMPYDSLTTSTKDPMTFDFNEMVTNVEVEHALTGCKGRIEYTGGFRHLVNLRFSEVSS